MSELERCLLITDPRNLPGENTFYGKIHSLTKEVAKINSDQLNYELKISTPEKTITQLSPSFVVFDRTLSYTETIKSFHEKCLQLGIPYLNDPMIMKVFANKFMTFEILKNHGISQPYTKQIKSENDLSDFIKMTGVGKRFVVKPDSGGMGDWVTFIKINDTENLSAFWNDGGQVTEFSGRPNDYYNQILRGQQGNLDGDTRATEGPIEWIAQEYLDTRGINGFAKDIRVIEQRDASGKLVVAAMHGRKSSSQDFPLTNLSKGGSVCDISEILDGTGVSIIDLFDFCRKVDRVIETTTGHPIGEVGHDVAISNNRLYYIEGNTMPGYVFKNWVKLSKKVSDKSLDLLTPEERETIFRPLEYINNILR